MSVLSKDSARLKAVLLFLVCSLIAVSCPVVLPDESRAAAGRDDDFNGRWLLTIETDERTFEHPCDLQIEASGSARMVLLGPVADDDGLFRGNYDAGRLELAGRLDGYEARMSLTVQAENLIGKLESELYSASLDARRAPPAKPEIRVKDYPGILEGVWKGVQENFHDPRLNGVDWNGVRDKYLPIVRASRNDGELAVSLRRMLRELRSPTADIYISTGNPPIRLKAPRVSTRTLSDSAGYLAIRSFSSSDLYGFDHELDQAMDSVGGKPFIVVDLRGNRGESLEAALGALNILLPQARSIAYFVTREGYASLGIESIDRIDPAKLPAAFIDNPAAISQFKGAGMYLAGGKYKRPYGGRYLVLIDELCSGSCELFAQAMREAGVAELIGRRTRGTLAVSTSVTFTFVEWVRVVRNDVAGWQMTLPMMDILTAGRKRIDGTGIEPDLRIERSTDSDADLNAALERIARQK